MAKKPKKKDRLLVAATVVFPDVNKGLSYSSIARKIKLFVDGEYQCTYDMTCDKRLNTTFRLRSVVIATQVFETKEGDRIDLIQKYIVGQNFIEVTFPGSGKVRRKSISFESSNTIKLLQPQDFWK